MKACGRTTGSMARAPRHGPMEQSMKESIKLARSMVVGHSNGTMDQGTLVDSLKIILMVRVTICGRTAVNTWASGNKIRCMAMVFSHGQMASGMRVSTIKIKKKATEYFIGLMVANTMVAGRMANSMEKVPTYRVVVQYG